MGAIDDASDEILALTLRPTEDLHGYVTLLHARRTSRARLEGQVHAPL